jgi:hypothetical protein
VLFLATLFFRPCCVRKLLAGNIGSEREAFVGLAPGPRPPFKRFGYWLYAGQQDVLHLTEALPSENRPKNTSSTYDHVASDPAGNGIELNLQINSGAS